MQMTPNLFLMGVKHTWIGSKIYCKDVYLPHLKLDWNPKVFNIPEIKFTTNIKDIIEINFENKQLIRDNCPHIYNLSLDIE